MKIPDIYESEYRFCLILWENEPVSSGELVKLCAKRLEWKKSTTYTVIKRLSQRGVLKNEKGIVTSLVSKDEVQMARGILVFLWIAFTSGGRLTSEEAEQIRRLIDESEEG